MSTLHRGNITDPNTALEFILAGNSRFTLVSPKTGTRYTYKACFRSRASVWLISLLTGEDNSEGYALFGLVNQAHIFYCTKESKLARDSTPVKAFEYTFSRIKTGTLPVEFWHEGRCGKCGKTLTVPDSIRSGLGPTCKGKMRRNFSI